MKLVSGAKYFAGIKRPFFISQGMVSSAATDLGFTDIKFHERDKTLPVNPKLDPKYEDDWDEWVEAKYSGPTKEHDITRRWKWAIRRAGGNKITVVKAPEPVQDAPIEQAGTALIVVEVLFWVFVASRIRRK